MADDEKMIEKLAEENDKKEGLYPKHEEFIDQTSAAQGLRDDIDNALTGFKKPAYIQLRDNVSYCLEAIAYDRFSEEKDVEVFANGYDMIRELGIVLAISTWTKMLKKPHILEWLKENRPDDVQYRLETCGIASMYDTETNMISKNIQVDKLYGRKTVKPLDGSDLGILHSTSTPKKTTVVLTAKEKVSDVKELEDNYDRAMAVFANMKSFLGS